MMEPGIPKGVVESLRELVDGQDLIGRALEAMGSFWREAEPKEVDWAFTLEEFRPGLGAQMLCKWNERWTQWVSGRVHAS